MPSVAVIPIRSFELGKNRLSEVLDGGSRAELGRQLARVVTSAAEEAGLLPVIVTGDSEVAGWSMGLGLPAVPDPGHGLSAAASAGVAWAEDAASEWLVVHSDLPIVTAPDLTPLRDTVEHGEWVIAPSSDGGTSAIGGPGRIEFAYGPGSFSKHVARAPNPRIVARTGLLLDIDTPSDLLAASRHPQGAWLKEFIP